MADKKTRVSRTGERPAARRFYVVLLCVLAMIGLISCQKSERSATTPESRTPKGEPLKEIPVQQAARPAAQPQQAPITIEPYVAGEPAVRVAITKDAPVLRLSTSAAEARVFNAANQEIERVPRNTVLEIASGPSGLVVNGTRINETQLRLESLNPDVPLRFNDQDIAARLTLIRAKSATLTLVAHLPMEEYLAGVLAGEVPYDKWHSEALKAQAITSRSFAFYQLRKNAGEPYDVESTVMSQVFKSGYKNNPVISSALASTRGMILTSGGAPFSAYFHSTCGDHTDPSTLVFPDRPAARPFTPVTCGFCSGSPAYRWKVTLEKRVLQEKLSSQFTAKQQLTGVAFLDASGAAVGERTGPLRRVSNVYLKKNDGSTTQLSANQFRLAAGPKELKSMLLEQVVDRGATIEISGGGFGHGAGLCQWGSQGMALAGYNHLQILGKYYAGAGLTRIY
ncbi:MAG TPA: SpoIID/LytB domain-containing protein [Planctomycetota bacterium]|nr:SpoIID/LytB domain-containing protein [Planctomycetota bacterium]